MSLLEVKQFTKKELNNIFTATKDEWIYIFEYLKKNKELEIFNGKITLVDVSFKGMTFPAVSIINEQNVDFLIVENFLSEDKKTLFLNFYAFEHYYNSDGDDVSLLAEVLKEGAIDDFDSIYCMKHTEQGDLSGSLESVYHYKQLAHFFMNFESILSELKGEYKDETDFYVIEQGVSKKINEAFKDKSDSLISLYKKIKNTTEKKVGNAMLKEIKINNEIYDTLVFDKGEEGYVVIFYNLEERDDYMSQNFSLHFYSSKNENYNDLTTFFENFDDYKNRSLYKFDITIDKKRGKKYDHSGDTKSIFLIKKLEDFFTLLENAEKK